MKSSSVKHHLFLLLAGFGFSLLTLTSCEHEDVLPAAPAKPSTGTPTTTPPTTTPPVTANSLLQQFDTQRYKYDAQNRLIELSFTNQGDIGYTVAYENDKPVRLNYRNGNHLLYTYAGEKVVEAVQYTPDNKVVFRFLFEYSGDKLVKETTLTYLSNEKGHLSIKDYVYDANSNLTEIVITWSPSNSPDDMRGPGVVKFGNYDNKINPVPYANMFFYLPDVKLHRNNPGFRDPGINKTLYTYTYHASGMPVKRSTQIQDYPELPPAVEEYSY
ncbi:hypothetical protein [Pontibacter sp. BAB1700]|uniref:hypothetical protein n=1 Tax=Pontibacter sp. BAB1700 TaxID=1144253 RepID=UPI0012DCB450|nr:hypothetical protein [Pontibacter sp. BAB1700]